MCGIFGYLGQKENGGKLVLEGLKKLEYRGYDSWGIVLRRYDSKGKPYLIVKKRVGKIGEVKINLPPATMALGHTRWATHGGVIETNTHPHLDCSGKIAIVHNGIIENYDQIRGRLIRLGHQFVSDTDSEVMAHLIEEYFKQSPFKEAFRRAFSELEGLNAVIALDSIGESFVASKTGSPLVIGFGQKEYFLASDAQALLSRTRQVHFLEDNQLVEIGHRRVSFFDIRSGRKLKLKTENLDWEIKETGLGKYPHFMIKEIFEQPKILKSLTKTIGAQIPRLAKIVRKAYGTYMIGCGSASYAALSGTYYFSRIAKRHVNFALGSEFGYTLDFLTPKSLVIAFSQSGETIDIIESVSKAQEKKAKILAIVNNLGSTLYRMADYKMLLGAGPETAVCATKTFTAKLAMVILLSYGLNGGLAFGIKTVLKAVKAVEKIFKKKSLNKIRNLANKLASSSHIYIVGRGQSYPVALETALKIKEISYLHAEGFAGGELKHGVIALIEKGVPCLIFAPKDETFGAVISGAMEMKARGGYIIGISPQSHEIFDDYVPVDDCGEATSIPCVVVAQLLAYFLALKLKLNPDKPRNLAKSVTVK